MKILVSGANGFVGSHLCQSLADAGHEVRAALRASTNAPPGVRDSVIVGEIGPDTQWAAALEGVHAVVHLAARVHQMNDSAANQLHYQAVNLEGTSALADAALRAGVRRFVFLSTVKVNGERTGVEPFRATDIARPSDAYAESKCRAEERLLSLVPLGLDPLILRPPLVYGPGVRANFLRLMNWIDRGIPLPLASIANSRSMINIWNLSDLICRMLTVEVSAARTFLAADGAALSTPELIGRLARAMGRRPRLMRMPPRILLGVANLMGRGAEVTRLCESLRVDDSQTRQLLGWVPPVSIDQGLARTAQWFMAARRHAAEWPR